LHFALPVAHDVQRRKLLCIFGGDWRGDGHLGSPNDRKVATFAYSGLSFRP
jgi:hypothetical protein